MKEQFVVVVVGWFCVMNEQFVWFVGKLLKHLVLFIYFGVGWFVGNIVVYVC
jgi:hypothetical protein